LAWRPNRLISYCDFAPPHLEGFFFCDFYQQCGASGVITEAAYDFISVALTQGRHRLLSREAFGPLVLRSLANVPVVLALATFYRSCRDRGFFVAERLSAIDAADGSSTGTLNVIKGGAVEAHHACLPMSTIGTSRPFRQVASLVVIGGKSRHQDEALETSILDPGCVKTLTVIHSAL
jgi:hypothetical protein